MFGQIKVLLRCLIKVFFRTFGYEAHIYKPSRNKGHFSRPVGNMQMFLEDLLARGLSPQAILDVGANKGSWSKMAKSIFPESEILMIEPQVEMKPFLDDFCERMNNSSWILAGAGSAPGEMVLNVYDDLAGSSFLVESDSEERLGTQRSVPVVTIDSLLENGELPVPQLVKLDVQGFELEVLRGGGRLFGNTEVFILEVSLFKFMEQMPLLHEVIYFMERKGYVVYDFPGFLRRPYDGALGQVDICFVKQGGFLRDKNNW